MTKSDRALVATVLIAAVACASGGGQPGTTPPASESRIDSAVCRPARIRSSPILWSCVIPAGDARIVHGLSGLYYDGRSSRLWAASDVDDLYPKEPARLLRFRLQPGQSITLESSLTLGRRASDGATDESAPIWQLEGIAPVIENGTWSGALFVSTENDRLVPSVASQIYRCDQEGRCAPALTMPPEFESVSGQTMGLQRNLGLEGLTVSPNGQRLFAAVESPLAQELPPPGERGRIRLLEYRLDQSRSLLHEYAYPLDLAPEGSANAPGVSEILALSADRLLVLERSYAPQCGNTIRVFQVTLDPSLALSAGEAVAQVVPLQKQLLLDFTDEKGAFDHPKLSATLDNFEGMTPGPDLPDGSHTLLLVSDDNRRSEQVTALVSVNLSVLPTAAARRWRDGDRPVCPATLTDK